MRTNCAYQIRHRIGQRPTETNAGMKARIPSALLRQAHGQIENMCNTFEQRLLDCDFHIHTVRRLQRCSDLAALFRKVQVVFVGDACQLGPVESPPVYSEDTLRACLLGQTPGWTIVPIHSSQ